MLRLKAGFGTSDHTDNSLGEKKVLFSYNISPSSNTIPLNGIFSLKNKMCAFLIHSFSKLLLIFKINLGKQGKHH